MKEREERKARLEREEKQRDQQARKMHYLLSTKQVSLPVPGSSHEPPGPLADRDKVAGWIGHDLLKRYHKDTTSSSISCLCVGARRRWDWSVTELPRGSHWAAGGKVLVSRVVRQLITQHGVRNLAFNTSPSGSLARCCVVNWSRASKLLSWAGFQFFSFSWTNAEIKTVLSPFLSFDGSCQVKSFNSKLPQHLQLHMER